MLPIFVMFISMNDVNDNDNAGSGNEQSLQL